MTSARTWWRGTKLWLGVRGSQQNNAEPTGWAQIFQYLPASLMRSGVKIGDDTTALLVVLNYGREAITEDLQCKISPILLHLLCGSVLPSTFLCFLNIHHLNHNKLERSCFSQDVCLHREKSAELGIVKSLTGGKRSDAVSIQARLVTVLPKTQNGRSMSTLSNRFPLLSCRNINKDSVDCI